LYFDRSFNINKIDVNVWYKKSVLNNAEIKGALRTDMMQTASTAYGIAPP